MTARPVPVTRVPEGPLDGGAKPIGDPRWHKALSLIMQAKRYNQKRAALHYHHLPQAEREALLVRATSKRVWPSRIKQSNVASDE